MKLNGAFAYASAYAFAYIDPPVINLRTVVLIVLALAAVAAVVGVIIWIVYRIKTDERLEQDRTSMETTGRPPERSRHESGDPDTALKGLLVTVLVIIAMVIVMTVTNKRIDRAIGQAKNEMSNQYNRLAQQMSYENAELQRRLDELLKEQKRQTSLIASFSVTPVENSFDPATETFAFIIGITPKQSDATTEITLTIGDDFLTTERDGDVFRAEYRSPLFDSPDCNKIMASVRQNDESTPVRIDPELFESVWLLGYEKIEEYLPRVKCGFSSDNNCTRDGDTFRYDDRLNASIGLPELTDDTIVSAALVVRVNGVEKARHELTDQLTDDETSLRLSAGISGAVAAGSADAHGAWEVSFTFEIIDSFGYVYEYGLEGVTFDESDPANPIHILFVEHTDDPRRQIVRDGAR